MFKWEEGRQNSGYFKMKLFVSKWLRMDIYLLKFKEGSRVPWHTDPAKTGKHYRANITLKPCKSGGIVCTEGKPIIRFPGFMLFRPDIIRHCMVPVYKGELLMLSIGKVIKD